MGVLYYGATRVAVAMDDRVMAALMVAATAKLRRGEGFLLSWRDADAVGDGRSAIWVSDSIELHFKFSGGRPPAVDQALVERMLMASILQRGIELDEATLVRPPNASEDVRVRPDRT